MLAFKKVPSEAQMQLPSKPCQAIKILAGLEVDTERVFDLGYWEAPAKQYHISFKRILYCSKDLLQLVLMNKKKSFY